MGNNLNNSKKTLVLPIRLTPERPGTERAVEKFFRVKYDMLASFKKKKKKIFFEK